jgi:hypothetical protein
MESPETVAVLAGGLGLLGGGALVLLKWWLKERRSRSPDPLDRAKALPGKWTGRIHQLGGPAGTRRVYDSTLDLSLNRGPLRRSDLTGRWTVSFEEEDGNGNKETVTLIAKVEGNFYFERFLRLAYVDETSEGLLLFGAAVLELDARGASLHGKLVGYGAKSKAIVNADVGEHTKRT